MTFLIKPPRTRGLTQLRTSDELIVSLADVTRVKSRHHVAGFGAISESEVVGKDDGTLSIRAREERRPDGQRTASRLWAHVKRRPSDLHAVVRRLRDDDAAKVAALDADIDDLKAAIQTLRTRRASVIADAWKRGAEVPLP